MTINHGNCRLIQYLNVQKTFTFTITMIFCQVIELIIITVACLTLSNNTTTRAIYTESVQSQVNFHEHFTTASNAAHPIRFLSWNSVL